jgi:hypothetical protein
MIAFASYLFTFLMGHYVTVGPGIEAMIFYVVGLYNLMMYFAIQWSDPGWLDEK